MSNRIRHCDSGFPSVQRDFLLGRSAQTAEHAAPVLDSDHCGYTRLRARTIERYDAVHRLRAQAKGLRRIAKELDTDRKANPVYTK
ncbi:hypothetical protein ACQP2U_24200 [Nocardia sp. CA-084685]|uniref:hypothetical protein n=1 Tax=Nocardia sp. CA-084685 TaxID=3239970 RepID=UPI003D98CFDA